MRRRSTLTSPQRHGACNYERQRVYGRSLQHDQEGLGSSAIEEPTCSGRAILFRPSDVVRVNCGALANLTGVIDRLTDSPRYAIVMMDYTTG